MAFPSESDSDRGSTLIELLLAAGLLGLVSMSLALAANAVAPMTRVTSENLDLARDIERIDSFLSGDLAAYPTLDTAPSALAHLPGSNVVTMSGRAMSGQLSNGQFSASQIVSYRYVPSGSLGNAGHIVRFGLVDASTTASESRSTTLSRNLPPPPSGWSSGDSVAHASTVSITERLTGESERTVDIVFVGGIRTKVSGVYREDNPVPTSAPPPAPVTLPTNRCAGAIAIVLNTSSTTWGQGAASTVTGDISDFVNTLRGAPVHVRILGFDRSAYSLYPETPVGSYVEVLNPSSALTSLHSRLSLLASTSSSWRNGRNWEDGLWQATRRDTGTLFTQLPDLIIFITDGTPNRNRTNTSSDTDTTYHAADLTRAIAAADYARSVGATLVGIMLGSGADSTATGHLRSVFGPLVWDGSANPVPLWRSRTFSRPTAEGFARLDEIFSLISAWRCGGTLTLQQNVLANGVSAPATDTWSFAVRVDGAADPTTAIVDRVRTATTIDLGIADPARLREIVVTLPSRAGFRHLSAACTASGAPLSTSTLVDSVGNISIRMVASERSALSCTMTSESLS